MKMNINGENHEVECHAVAYPNDILDGVFLDLGEDYGFLSDHVESHRALQEVIPEMGYYDMSELNIDYDKAPHCWAVASVGRLIVQTCEELIAD